MIPRFPNGFSHPVPIGTGGYGSVYRARQDALGRLVALKFIVEKNAAARAVLIKEASLQAGLHIRGIPQIYDVREISGSVCIIMQWINGCSLRTILEQEIGFHHKQCIAAEIIGIVASLHEQGYAHRDIKPENIIISADGVFLIDFGLTLHINRDVRQTVEDVIKGTPAYIAPELLRGGGRDADLKRADLYSMGKVIRELAGEKPLPAGITACLHESPDMRPGSAREVLRQWEAERTRAEVDWNDIAEPCASGVLARQLHQAALQLLDKKNIAEAYDLLVESLQAHPDSPDALELMARFPVIRKKSSAAIVVRIAVAGVILLLIGTGAAVVLRKGSPADECVAVSEQAYGRSLFLPSSRVRGEEINKTLPLKDAAGSFPALDGRLEIAGCPEAGALYIDGKRMGDGPATIYLSALNREHSVIWKAGNDVVFWKEIITLLPFETKKIFIRER